MLVDRPLPLHLTFGEDDWHILARHWYPITSVSALGDAPFGTTLLDEPLVVYRAGGTIVVARDVCPHRGVPLSLGSVEDGGVVCPYHGLRYGADGRCNRVPASPNARIPERLKLRTYPSCVRYGLVWTCLAPEAGVEPAVPPMPHWDEPAFQQIVCPAFDIAGFAGRQVEGFIDVAHFAWVHTETFADPDNATVPQYDTRETATGFSADYRSEVGNYPIGASGRGRPGFEWLRHFEVHVPFTATLTIHFPDDGRLVIMNAASPMSLCKTRLFAPICRNFDQDQPIEQAYEFNLRVFAEDRRMVESQKPEYLPLDTSLEAHIPADRSSVAYRKRLAALGLSPMFLA